VKKKSTKIMRGSVDLVWVRWPRVERRNTGMVSRDRIVNVIIMETKKPTRRLLKIIIRVVFGSAF